MAAEKMTAPTTIEGMQDGVLYSTSMLARIILPRGRRLQEALAHDPLAPASRPGPSVQGKYYTKADIEAFALSYTGPEAQAAYLTSEAGRIARQHAAEIAASAARAQDDRAALKKAMNDAAEAAEVRAKAAERKAAQRATKAVMKKFGRTLPANVTTGIYFLYLRGKLQYIGQAVDVYARIAVHRREKTFDEAKFLACTREELNDWEGFFIRLLEPPLNGGKMAAYHNAPASKIWGEMFTLSFVDPGAELQARPFSSSPVSQHHDA